MTKRQNADIRTWALKGAEQRRLEIAEEAAQIYRYFPELRGRGAVVTGGLARRQVVAADGAPRRRRRSPTFSAAQRKAISRRMKKYWAERRRAKR